MRTQGSGLGEEGGDEHHESVWQRSDFHPRAPVLGIGSERPPLRTSGGLSGTSSGGVQIPQTLTSHDRLRVEAGPSPCPWCCEDIVVTSWMQTRISQSPKRVDGAGAGPSTSASSQASPPVAPLSSLSPREPRASASELRFSNHPPRSGLAAVRSTPGRPPGVGGDLAQGFAFVPSAPR